MATQKESENLATFNKISSYLIHLKVTMIGKKTYSGESKNLLVLFVYLFIRTFLFAF